VQDQLARILSLDADGSGFAEVGRRDPVVSRLQERYPGLRPVNFWSPYQAAVWAILSTRVRMTQAANTNARLTRQMGSGQDIHGETLFAFPSRERLKQIEVSDGVPARKAEYLHAVADAALKGRLDSWRLRNVPKQQALALLQEIPGIGPFGAELILLRGAGEPDHFPSAEPRLVEAMTRLYELKHPGRGDLEQISERWRPYRTWTSVLIRNWWQDQAGQLAPR
jgi:DNA-3-methyladenine glycosylase II